MYYDWEESLCYHMDKLSRVSSELEAYHIQEEIIEEIEALLTFAYTRGKEVAAKPKKD